MGTDIVGTDECQYYVPVATQNIQLEDAEVVNLLAFLERLVCHEGDKQFPPRFSADYIRTEVRRLIDKIETQSGVKLNDLVFGKTAEPVPGAETCNHIYSSRGTCQLCGASR